MPTHAMSNPALSKLDFIDTSQEKRGKPPAEHQSGIEKRGSHERHGWSQIPQTFRIGGNPSPEAVFGADVYKKQSPHDEKKGQPALNQRKDVSTSMFGC